LKTIFAALLLSLLAGIGCERAQTPVTNPKSALATPVAQSAEVNVDQGIANTAAGPMDTASAPPVVTGSAQIDLADATAGSPAKETAAAKPPRPSDQSTRQRIDTMSNNLMTRQVNQRATQIQNAGLTESNQLLESYTANAFHKEVVKLMQYAADYTLLKRRNHWRIVQAPEWKQLMKKLERRLSRYRRKSRQAQARLNDVMMAVLRMLDNDGPFERASAYALMDHIFTAVGKTLPRAFEGPFIRSAAARMTLATSVHERTMLVESALKHDREGELFAFAISVVLSDKDWAVRKKALDGLDRCATVHKKCKLAPVMLDLLYNRHTDARTRGPLMLYAAALLYPKVTNWCRPHLRKSSLMLPCRTALGRLQTEEAFDLLYKWLDKRKDEASSKRPQNYSFRDEFKSIMPYANKRFARYKFPQLLDTVLGQDLRDGFATGGIVRMMDQMEDAKRALQILKATRAFYKVKFGDHTLHRSQKFLMNELDIMIKRMKPRALKQHERERKEMIHPKK